MVETVSARALNPKLSASGDAASRISTQPVSTFRRKSSEAVAPARATRISAELAAPATCPTDESTSGHALLSVPSTANVPAKHCAARNNIAQALAEYSKT